MTANSATKYLKYANLQMAAEALLDDPESYKTQLTTGNNRSSRFTDALVDQLITDGWTVFDHKPDTTTGFSGTLFKNTATGELVISFRSTEFADDSARDNEATNTLEIKPYGWAFGQISDMKSWYDSLLSSGKLSATDKFAVTGYSLGGHLATAFNQLLSEIGQANTITSTYTFNGAGVGQFRNGGTLTAAIAAFNSHRDASNETYFTSAAARDLYMKWRPALNGNANALTRLNGLTEVSNVRTALASNPQTNLVALRELDVLRNAISRGKAVYDEAQRVAAGLGSGSTGPTAQVVTESAIAATKLDYQLAVLQAQVLTRAFASTITDGLGAAYATSRAPLILSGASPIYDVYGSPLPSAVANSQHHYGVPTPIFVEDQPLLRGNILPTRVRHLRRVSRPD